MPRRAGIACVANDVRVRSERRLLEWGMTIVTSLALAYLVSGLMQLRRDLSLPPDRRPGWAMHPTLERAVLAGATWFVRPYVDARRVTGRPRNALVSALAVVGVQLAVFTAFIRGCIAAAGHLLDTTAGVVALSALFILVGAPVLSAPIARLCAAMTSRLRRR